MSPSTDTHNAQALAIALRPLLAIWKPRTQRDLQARTQAMALIDEAISVPDLIQVQGRITAGDATLRTLTIHIEDEIPAPLRTMGEPVMLVHGGAEL